MITVLYVILYTSIVTWAFPPFRQHKTKYFYFFLILALSDPIHITLGRLLGVNRSYYYLSVTLLLVLSLIEFKVKKQILLGSFFVLIIIFTSLMGDTKVGYAVFVACQVVILIFFLRDLFIDIRENENINLFYIVMILYIVSIIIKMVFYIVYQSTGYLYLFITNIFQLLIGIYFICYNVNNSRRILLFKKNVNAINGD